MEKQYSEDEKNNLLNIISSFKKLSKAVDDVIPTSSIEEVLSNDIIQKSGVTSNELKRLAGIQEGIVADGKVLVVNDDGEVGIEDGLTIDFEKALVSNNLIVDFRGGQSIVDRFSGDLGITGPTIQNIDAVKFNAPSGEFKPLVLTYSQIAFLRSFFNEWFDNDKPSQSVTSSIEVGKTLAQIAGGNVFTTSEKQSLENLIKAFVKVGGDPLTQSSVEGLINIDKKNLENCE